MEHQGNMVYEKPIVKEAIVFVRFEGDANDGLYGAYHELVKKEYPTFKPVTTENYFTLSRFPGYSDANEKGLMTFTSLDLRLSITLGTNLLAFHVIEEYPGWQEVFASFKIIFDYLIRVTKLTRFTALGLRYLNVIEMNTGNETLSYWLKPNDFLPAALLDSFPIENYDLTVNHDNGNEITEVALFKLNDDLAYNGVVIWDIYRCNVATHSGDAKNILSILDRIHEDISGPQGIFSTAIGPNLSSLMNPTGGKSHENNG